MSGVADYEAASIRAQHADLIQGLIDLRPKKRAPKASWVVFGGCTYFIVALLGDHSVREAIFAPKGEARAPQYVATAPAAPQRAPIQVQARPQPPVQVAQQQPAVVTFAPFAVPAAPAEQADAPLPRTKAHHTAPTRRAHGSKHTR